MQAVGGRALHARSASSGDVWSEPRSSGLGRGASALDLGDLERLERGVRATPPASGGAHHTRTGSDPASRGRGRGGAPTLSRARRTLEAGLGVSLLLWLTAIFVAGHGRADVKARVRAQLQLAAAGGGDARDGCPGAAAGGGGGRWVRSPSPPAPPPHASRRGAPSSPRVFLLAALGGEDGSSCASSAGALLSHWHTAHNVPASAAHVLILSHTPAASPAGCASTVVAAGGSALEWEGPSPAGLGSLRTAWATALADAGARAGDWVVSAEGGEALSLPRGQTLSSVLAAASSLGYDALLATSLEVTSAQPGREAGGAASATAAAPVRCALACAPHTLLHGACAGLAPASSSPRLLAARVAPGGGGDAAIRVAVARVRPPWLVSDASSLGAVASGSPYPTPLILERFVWGAGAGGAAAARAARIASCAGAGAPAAVDAAAAAAAFSASPSGAAGWLAPDSLGPLSPAEPPLLLLRCEAPAAAAAAAAEPAPPPRPPPLGGTSPRPVAAASALAAGNASLWWEADALRGSSLPPASARRIAIVSSVWDHVDGVSKTLRTVTSTLLARNNGSQQSSTAPDFGTHVLLLTPDLPHPGGPGLGRARLITAASSASSQFPGLSVVPIPSLPAPGRPDYRWAPPLPSSAAAQLALFSPTAVHVAAPDFLGHSAVAWARTHGVCSLCTYHTAFPTYVQYYGLGFVEPGVTAFAGSFYRRCDVVAVPTHAAADALAAAGVPRSSMAFFPRGVDASLYNVGARRDGWAADVARAAPGEATILWVARTVREKGIDTFVAALLALHSRVVAGNASAAEAASASPGESLSPSRSPPAPPASSQLRLRATPPPRFRVVIAGTGPDAGMMRASLPEGPGSATSPPTIYLGHATGRDLAAALASADIFFFPSRTEVFPNNIVEAMACGAAVVAEDVPVVRALVVHNATGILVPPVSRRLLPRASDANAHADALHSLLLDPEERRRLGAAAAASTVGLTWDRAVGALVTAYDACGAAKAAGAARATQPHGGGGGVADGGAPRGALIYSIGANLSGRYVWRGEPPAAEHTQPPQQQQAQQPSKARL